MSDLLFLIPAHGMFEIYTDQEACDRNKSNDRQMGSPSIQNLGGDALPITEASRNALLIQETPHGWATALGSWREEPTQPNAMEETPCFLDEEFHFSTNASRRWLHALQQFFGGEHTNV
jgi:hypothetical protein